MKNIIPTIIMLATMLAPEARAADQLADWQRQAVEQIRSRKGVIDARWRFPKKNALWVNVEPDRYHADIFAHYLCDTLKDVGTPKGEVTKIWIFDPASYRDNGWPMGTAECR